MAYFAIPLARPAPIPEPKYAKWQKGSILPSRSCGKVRFCDRISDFALAGPVLRWDQSGDYDETPTKRRR